MSPFEPDDCFSQPLPARQGVSDPIASIDQALVAGGVENVERALKMAQEIQEQLRLRLQWALVDQLWSIKKSQPWARSVTLEWHPGLEHFTTSTEAADMALDEEALREHVENPALLGLMERVNPGFVDSAKSMKRQHGESREFFARHFLAGAIEDGIDNGLSKLWESLGAPESGSQSLRLDFSSREALAQSLLPPQSLAAWEAACLRVAMGDSAPSSESSASEKERPIPAQNARLRL